MPAKGYGQTPEHRANAAAGRRAAQKSRPMSPNERGRLGAAARWKKPRAAVVPSTPATENPNDATTQEDLHIAHAYGVVEATLRNLAADAGISLRVLAGRMAVLLSHRSRG